MQMADPRDEIAKEILGVLYEKAHGRLIWDDFEEEAKNIWRRAVDAGLKAERNAANG